MEVEAAQIEEIERHEGRLALATGQTIHLGDAWFRRYRPEVGGYLVIYAGGYATYYPCDTFEQGYTACA